jgi:hypothetical protein
MQIHKVDERVILYARNGADWTEPSRGLLPMWLGYAAGRRSSMPSSSTPNGFEALYCRANKHTDEALLSGC